MIPSLPSPHPVGSHITHALDSILCNLYIDIGNSRVKWALAFADAQPGSWISHGAATHSAWPTVLVTWQLPPMHRIAHIWCAHVANTEITNALEQQVRTFPGTPRLHWVRTPTTEHNLRNTYRPSSQLGIDRWLAALAARRYAPYVDILIINMGTATTIDSVSANGDFLGGWILPGLTTMLTSLGKTTAQLPHVSPPGSFTYPWPHVANNTLDAMQQGCLAAQIGAIAYCQQQVSRLLGKAPRCFMTGGAAKEIAAGSWLTFPVEYIDNLVLLGLHRHASPSL